MIIGNPGIYDSKGNFNNFAIQIDNIVDTDYFSVNLCIDMNIYPPQLASNKASYLIDYFNPELEIFSNIHDDLFYLDDRDLMINLMAKGFVFNKNRSYDLDYIEDRLLLSNIRASKSVGFFDEQFWGVKVSCIKTDELSLIINKIQSVLSAFK